MQTQYQQAIDFDSSLHTDSITAEPVATPATAMIQEQKTLSCGSSIVSTSEPKLCSHALNSFMPIVHFTVLAIRDAKYLE
ncbi:hypothetical protein J6590_082346 [Homalodisca vitripennis]|nr:hypothetical protein J6590_082346 [Homalodisca vitripennis]